MSIFENGTKQVLFIIRFLYFTLSTHVHVQVQSLHSTEFPWIEKSFYKVLELVY